MASISKETDGKYISGRNDSDIQPENSSAAAHIRKPIPTKGRDGKHLRLTFQIVSRLYR